MNWWMAANASHPGSEAMSRITEIGHARMVDAKRRQEKSKFAAQGEVNFQTVCVACHGANGKGTSAPGLDGVMLGAPLVGSPRVLGTENHPHQDPAQRDAWRAGWQVVSWPNVAARIL